MCRPVGLALESLFSLPSHTQPVLSGGLPAVPFPQVSHGLNNQEQSPGQAHSAEATGPSQGVMGLGVVAVGLVQPGGPPPRWMDFVGSHVVEEA